jgi:outer membrane protein OmpA-like peptidoglycan-associated protein
LGDVLFDTGKFDLRPEARERLAELSGIVLAHSGLNLAIEGYTDSTGSKQYNEELSKRRADAVVEYLVAKHDIPIYRIHMVGLGPEKPVDEARNRAARAKNRRVEVKIFSADQVTASLSANRDNSASRTDTSAPANITPASANQQ